MMDLYTPFEPLINVFGFIGRFWWIWSGPVLVIAFERAWLTYRQALYKNAIEWTMLELKMPREVIRSPKAMDQFFTALSTVRNSPGDFLDKYQTGEVTLWFSLELVSFGGEIHFYIRTHKKHKDVISANLYANYPTLEVEEVEDYVDVFPPDYVSLTEHGYDIFGTELTLAKADAYPIRTYVQFEDMEESRNLDPISSVLEVLGKIKARDNVLIQILIRPADSSWKEKGDALVKELKEKGAKRMVSPLGEYEDKPIRTPGETDVLKAIEASISKPGYETLIRYLYIGEKTTYNEDLAKRGVLAAFNQYGSLNLNSFKGNSKVSTFTKWTQFPYLFPQRRIQARKRRIYSSFLRRKMPEETGVGRILSSNVYHAGFSDRTFVLNTEELATLFHPPTSSVLTAPLLQRIESKKMGPAAGLPIFKEDSET